MIPLSDSRQDKSVPYATDCLILINIVAFLTFRFHLDGNPLYLHGLAIVPRDVEVCLNNLDSIFSQPVLFLQTLVRPFFSSMFLHADWLHLLGNLWFLFVFGKGVESRLGHFRFLAFYLACGVAAGVFHVAISLELGQQQVELFGRIMHFGQGGAHVPVIGASGAVAGVLGAYFISYPMAKVLVLLPPFFLFHLPALAFLGFWFVYQIFNARAASQTFESYSNVAWWAHVGGFLAGIALVAIRTLMLPVKQNTTVPQETTP